MFSQMNPRGPLVLPGITYSTLGQNIFYVHHNAPSLADLPEGIAQNTRTTINDALSLCSTGRGDVIQLLPGYTESIATADAWSNLGSKTGVTILGPQTGPPAVLTWTAAGSTVLFDAAGFTLDGGYKRSIVLNMDPGTGSVTVAAPITISDSYCGIWNCRGRTSTDSNSLTTVPIAMTDAADDCFIVGNHLYGATAGECTTMLDIAGADRLYMAGNVFSGATSNTGVGIVRFKTTAATHVWLAYNFYANRKASSTMAVTGVAAVTGCSFNELFHYLDNSTTTMWGTSPGNMAFYNPRTVNLAGEAGMLSTVVST